MKDIDHTKFDQWQFLFSLNHHPYAFDGRELRSGIVNLCPEKMDDTLHGFTVRPWRGFVFSIGFLYGASSLVSLNFDSRRKHYSGITLIPRLEFHFRVAPKHQHAQSI